MVIKLACIELDISGAHFSSLLTFPTLLCTFTNALISLDSNKLCRKLSSCSLDKLSVSFNDVTNFDKTVTTKCAFNHCELWFMNSKLCIRIRSIINDKEEILCSNFNYQMKNERFHDIIYFQIKFGNIHTVQK